jgi:2-keto-3-deoxy-L-rhamnonate aldolase RhmA
MRVDALRRRLDGGEVAYGVVTSWPDPDLAEAAGLCGFDFVFIDAEHGALDIKTCAELVRAADCGGATSLIRVPYADPRGFYPYLDLGAHGLIFPHVRNGAEARAVVDASLFPPDGMRGALSSSRAARYGTASTAAEYFATANASTWVFPVIEDVEAVDALDEIVSTPGINCFFVGPGDLGLSRIAGGRRDAPSVETLVDRAIATGTRHRKIVATVAATPAAAATLVTKGVRMIATGASSLFTSASREFLAASPRK